MKTILVIGSGISGLMSAYNGAKNGAKVILVSPMPSERAQSNMAAGGINAVLDSKGENDTIQAHVEDTLRGGCMLEDRVAVQNLCENAPEIINELDELGVVFSRDDRGNVDLRAFGGQSHKRTAYAGASTGKQIVSALIRACRKYEVEGKIERILNENFIEGLIKDGVCYGGVFLNRFTNEVRAIYADAVVMAVGGANKLFGKTTGSTLCDGSAVGQLFLQGVSLRNLEFIQYHPTTMETTQKRMLITEGARGEGGRLFYFDGDKKVYFMEDKYGAKGNLMPRDIVAKAIYDAPSKVYLDITFLGKKVILQKLEEVYALVSKYANLDVCKDYIEVYPSVHFFMGGIRVNLKHESNIANLYAVGECASMYHGANRLGGNSLLAAIYSAKVAIGDICEKEQSAKVDVDFSEEIAKISKSIAIKVESKSEFPAIYLENELAKIMNDDLGITRTEEKLQKGLQEIDFYLKAIDKLFFDTNVSAYEAYRIKNMFVLAKATLISAIERKESRGAHIREDYAESCDEFAKNSVIDYAQGKFEIRFVKGLE